MCMKISIVFLSFLWMNVVKAGPGDTAHLYDPNANAQKDIAAAVAKAKAPVAERRKGERRQGDRRHAAKAVAKIL